MVTQTQTPPQASRPIPFVKGLPLLGSLPAYNSERLDLFLRITQECGDVGGMHFGPFPLLVFNTSDYVHAIFVEHAYDFDKGVVIHSTFRPIMGNGLFISEGDLHRKQRKLIAPSFQPRHLASYADAIVGYGERIQHEWRDGQVIDASREMTALTMSIIGKALFDADVFTETDELGAAVSEALAYSSHRLSRVFPPPASWPTPRNRRMRRAITVIRNRIGRMIDERRANPAERSDFLSILLQARGEDGSAMSDRQISDECVTLFGAGHETTATALTWAWYLLCQHPDLYQKVQCEVDTVLQGRAPCYEDLPRLPYCLQVFKETLRLYPPVYAISRQALKDITIDGYLVRKGQAAAIIPYALHRRPDYFPDPEKFDPGRFTHEREQLLPRYAFVPFGAGPRICIGNYFAMMEGHLLLATLAQRVSFELASQGNVEPDPYHTLALRPAGGLPVIVKRRDLRSQVIE
jgi:cytochrome P450